MSNSKEETKIPLRTDVEWHNYVMGLFDESELYDGMPLVAGLRRVSQLVLGPIVSSRPVQVFAPTDIAHMGRATVVYEVQFQKQKPEEKVKKGEAVATLSSWGDNVLTFADVADCFEGNADDLVALHPAATASTRAEARALRKALGLTCVSAEELTRNKDIVKEYKTKVGEPTDGSMKTNDGLSVNQKKCIGVICDKIKVDPVKMANHLVGKEVEALTKGEASKVIDSLSKMQNGELEIPKL
jgi:hypothetical protein